MKLITAILLIISFSAKATVYYVDNAGSNASGGTSTGSAWQTISKVNSSTFLPGDQILFKAGGVWNEKLIISSSGTSGNPIVISSYGTGSKPTITGLQTLAGFTNVGNIWTATATNSVKSLNTVLIDGSIRAKGRYPNTGYLTFTSYSGQNQITGSLTGTPDYTGAEVVVRSTHWILDVVKIASQSAGTLNLSPSISYVPNFGGNGYIIQNSPLVLDTAGEWSYDSATKVLKVYSLAAPSVQISTIDTLVQLSNKQYINFEGIAFTGANRAAFQIDTSNHIIIRNCSFNNSGTLALSALKSDYVTVVKDSIINSLSGAIYFRQDDPSTAPVSCNYAVIDSNYVKNTGTLQGMGLSKDGRYVGIYAMGTSLKISNNRIDSSGYIPILWGGANSIIEKNYVTNFCSIKDDGGGIYTYIGSVIPAGYNDGSIIRNNIVINGMGAKEGTTNFNTSNTNYSAGIYLDNNTRNVTVENNSIYNCTKSSVLLNDAHNNTLRNNTLYNSIGNGITSAGYIFNNYQNIIKSNVFYVGSTSLYVYSRSTGDTTGSIDSNYYFRPSQEAGKLQMFGTNYSLSEWQAATPYDKLSSSTPTDAATATPLFLHNTNYTDSTISIDGFYTDHLGRRYFKSITLSPFTSIVLFKYIIDIKGRVTQINTNNNKRSFRIKTL